MSGPTVSPWQALMDAKAFDPYRKKGSTMPKDVPAPPGTGSFGRFVHDVGYLIDLFLDPCQKDPWMLAVSAVPSILRAAWTIFEPDPKESFHILSGKSVVCTLKGEIHEAGTFERIGWDGAKNTLFRIAETADLAVWDLFLASVSVEGLIEWQTTAQRLSGCAGGSNPFSSTKAQGGIHAANGGEGDDGFEWLTGSDEFPAFTPDILLKPGDSGYILWHAEATAIVEDIPYPLAVWVVDEQEQIVHGPVYSQRWEQSPLQTFIHGADNTWHAPIVHFPMTNTTGGNKQYMLKARGLLEAPGGQLFFKSGYCAVRGSRNT